MKPEASPPQSPRRADALSRERILDAAIDFLDQSARGGRDLTLRTLMTELATGSGAIYHHVRNMDDLRAAAADEILSRHLPHIGDDVDAEDAVEQVASGIYDTITTHPWFGAQLARDTIQPAAVRIWKNIGTQLQRLPNDTFDATEGGSVLYRFVLGSAAQHIQGPGSMAPRSDRGQFLEEAAQQILGHGDDPVAASIASELTEHDDRDQFIAGVRLILRGMRT